MNSAEFPWHLPAVARGRKLLEVTILGVNSCYPATFRHLNDKLLKRRKRIALSTAVVVDRIGGRFLPSQVREILEAS